VAPSTASLGLVSLIDVGATVLELAGAVPPGARTTDGRSLVPVLAGGGGLPPAGWRTSVLVEHLGEKTQWFRVCGTVWDAPGCPAPNASAPPLPQDAPYLIDGPQNTWAMLRGAVTGGAEDAAYVEFRAVTAPVSRSATNWTELYDCAADPWQADNLAPQLGPAQLRAYRDALWAVANCSQDSCP